MRYIALISDYDGTLAHDGRTEESTLAALKRLRESGRKLVLVTGRELPDLIRVFPALDVFDLVIAENGALLYTPSKRAEQLLCDPPSAPLVERLRQKNVPISVGKGIVATWRPHEFEALQAIQELGLEHQVIFNKGAVMILPPGVNKRSGVDRALHELKLSNHNVVGVGDAENDHAFLSNCECAVAVANALPSLKECADIVTNADHGAGVVELIDEILRDDLQRYDAKLRRHQTLLGKIQGKGD